MDQKKNNLPSVEITISSIINDLGAGFSWFRKDDQGLGSIQDKYGATDVQIAVMKQHKKLVNIEPASKSFKIIDDIGDSSPTVTTEIPESSREIESGGLSSFIEL